MQNFTVVDMLGTLEACLALTPLTVAPGYAIGWAADLFEFRCRRPILRFILAVPLTIAICPMLSYLLARFVEPGLWVFYVGIFISCFLLLAKEMRRAKLQSISRHTWVALGMTGLWTILAIASLVDLQIGDKLYPPITAYDHSTRVAIMAAIARHVPPNNPFFVHPSVPLRYHYLWMLFCSLPLKLIHFQPRHLMYAGIVWCGVGLMCVIALALKFLLRVTANIEQKALLGAVLLCVTGLDILPTIYIGVVGHSWLSDMEWWNEVQITSWAASLLWVPHHVAALIACFVAFLLLRHVADTSRKRITIPVIVAGMAFASATGLSVYVTFTFVLAIGLWLLALVARKNWREAGMFVGAGAVALIWALPYLASLRGPGGGAAFVEFALRPFPLGIFLAQRLGVSIQSQSAATLANALFLPVNYALELGFFLAVAILRLWHLRRGRIASSTNERAAWTLVATSFLMGTFLRSSTIGSNDLGWRCFLPAQLILLLWGATMVYDWWFADVGPKPALDRWTRLTLALLLVLGVFGTTYEVFMLRMFPVLYDRGAIAGQTWVDSDRQFGKRTYALRSAYESLDAQLSVSAVIQNNPAAGDPVPNALYSGHDTAAGGPDCGIAFGGEESLCKERVRRLSALFQEESNDLEGTCREYGIDVVVAEDTDPAWSYPASWIWRASPLVSNRYVRAFRCAAAADSTQVRSLGVLK